MSYYINDPSCDTVSRNTGLSSCTVDIGLIVGGILCDVNFSLTPTQVLTIKEVLQAATLAEGTGRVYPLPRFEEYTDGSESDVEETLGYGAKQTIREGKQVRTFRFLKGGLCLLANLRSFNAQQKNIIYFAELGSGKWQIIGSKDSDGNIVPITLNQFKAHPVKLADGKTGNKYMITLSEQNPGEWDSYGVVQVDFDPQAEIIGINDLELTEVSVADDKVKVSVKTKCNQVDVYDDFKTLMADPDAWVVTKGGVVVVPDSVTADDATSSFEIECDGATGVHLITLESPAALAALGIGGSPSNGYEAFNTLSVTLGGS